MVGAMSRASSGTPTTYLAQMLDEIPGYEELQEPSPRRPRRSSARRSLELGTGTGETALRVLALHPDARWTGIDASEAMLAGRASGCRTPTSASRLEDPLPEGPFDLVVRVLAVHHLDGDGKRDLFARVAQRSPSVLRARATSSSRSAPRTR